MNFIFFSCYPDNDGYIENFVFNEKKEKMFFVIHVKYICIGRRRFH